LKLAGALVLVGAIALALALHHDGRRRGQPRVSLPGTVPIGMLGDSDTAAYQDTVSFPPAGPQPGGVFHSITLQWPEVLARIRAQQVDLGTWAVWGVPRWLSMARVRDAIGARWRGPQKQTHQHNLAWPSGCEALTGGPWRQAQRLIDVMDEQPARWEQGVVVIRIGVNSFGKDDDLVALAANPEAPEVVAKMATCVEQIGATIGLIHERHPKTRVVIVGIFNNSDWSPYLERWQSQQEQRNLNQGLDHFDDALRAMAAADGRLAFFDDRAWFAKHWGRRDPSTGAPAYRAVQIGNDLSVTNTSGDSPEHATLANEHAGLVWNVLWAADLVQLIRNRFGVPVEAISEADAAAFVHARLHEVAPQAAAKR
jgi:hypothetical protein